MITPENLVPLLKPPVSGMRGWQGLPEEVGEQLYIQLFMLGAPTNKSDQLKPEYTKVVYPRDPDDSMPMLSFSDDEGWEIYMGRFEQYMEEIDYEHTTA